MLMWVMSDRAIPRSFRFMEGFGVHTFRFVNAEGRSTFVKFHWKPKQGMQSVRVERGGEDQRRRSGLPPARPVGRDRAGRLPGVGARRPGLRRPLRRPVRRSTCSTPPSSSPRSCVPVPPDRPARARPHGRQLLRRDRAGRVLHPERRARDRLHQRPAAAGPQLLLPRHPAQAARAARTSPTSRSTPRSAPSPTSSRTGTWRWRNPVGRTNYEPNSWTGDERGPREDPASGLPDLRRRARRRRQAAAAARVASPTTTARRGSSSGARRRSSSSTSSTPSRSS